MNLHTGTSVEEVIANVAERHYSAPAPHISPRVYSFATSDGSVTRTRGVLLNTPSRGCWEPTPDELLSIARYWLRNVPDDCAAAGKFVILDGESVRVFQHVDGREKLTPAWCGNATAAALYRYGHTLGIRHALELRVRTGSREARVYGGFNERLVHQDWELQILPNSVREGSWDGRDYLSVDVLNPYLIFNDIDYAEADEARRSILGERADGKVAAITDTDGHPLVRFFTAYGEHGAAPMTGLATLAIARQFYPILAGNKITYRTTDGDYHTTELPEVSFDVESVRLRLPDVYAFIFYEEEH